MDLSAHFSKAASVLGSTILLSLLIHAGSTGNARADAVALTWNPSPSAEATGYNIYYGVSGVFTNKINAGNQLSTTISGLQAGVTYFFLATAYGGEEESGPSPIVSYRGNTAPVASNPSLQVYGDQSVSLVLTATDSEGDPLTYQIVTPPARGALNGIPPKLMYTPAAGYTGSDSFTYRANDGQLDSTLATVSIAVLAPPDVTAPAVAITAPISGSVLSAVASVVVAATDNVGVSRVELYQDGVLLGAASSAPASFTWDTRTVANGACTLRAKAMDLAGNVATSTSVSVSVQNSALDTTPPSVSIIKPHSSSSVSGTMQIEVTASDDVAVTQVQCFVGSSLLGTSTSSQSAFSWDTMQYPNGTYILQAQAFDAAGNSAAVSVPNIRVENRVPDTVAPIVTIATPQDGSTVSKNFSAKASASDDVGVTRLELFLDGSLVSSTSSAALSVMINASKLAKGLHSLVAKGCDAAGNQGISSTVTIRK